MRRSSVCASVRPAMTDPEAAGRRWGAEVARRRCNSPALGPGASWPLATINAHSELKRVLRTPCRSTPQRWWYRGVVAESFFRSAATSTCGRLRVLAATRRAKRWLVTPRRQQRRKTSHRYLASRCLDRCYPSREPRLRACRWTSRALLAKAASTIPRYRQRPGALRQDARGTPPTLCHDRRSWSAAGDTPRPSTGEQPPRPGDAEPIPAFTRIGSRLARPK
jgi:hypothetical protein